MAVGLGGSWVQYILGQKQRNDPTVNGSGGFDELLAQVAGASRDASARDFP